MSLWSALILRETCDCLELYQRFASVTVVWAIMPFIYGLRTSFGDWGTRQKLLQFKEIAMTLILPIISKFFSELQFLRVTFISHGCHYWSCVGSVMKTVPQSLITEKIKFDLLVQCWCLIIREQITKNGKCVQVLPVTVLE